MRGGDFTTTTRAVKAADLDFLARPGVRIPRSAYAKMVGRPIAEVFLLPAFVPAPVTEPEAPVDFTIPHCMPRRVRDAVASVAHSRGFTFDQMIQDERGPATVSSVRHEAYWVVRQMGFTLKQVAIYFRREDHTSIIHGLRKHEARRKAMWLAR